jgi:hypothetical protein
VPRPTWPLLRRVGQSFLAGTLAGLIWALLTIRRRGNLTLDGTG